MPFSTDGSQRRRVTVLWLTLLVPPLFALAVWASLWWQWMLPGEDAIGLSHSPMFFCLAGVVAGLATAKTGWTRRKAILFGLVALPLAQAAVFWAFLIVVMSIPLLLGYGFYRLARRVARGDPAWRVPLAVSLCPLLVALAFSLPPLDLHKWLWPWTSIGAQIVEFQAATDRAADSLGIPADRELTPSEIGAWSRQTPLRLRIPYPLIGKTVTVSVLNPWTNKRFPNGLVWAWWGGPGRPTFGALNTRTMTILSTGD